jgi:hypothetical protein
MATIKLRTVKATYDFASKGGAVSAITLPLAIPTGSLISRVFVKPATAATSGGLATIALALGGVALKAATAFDNAAYTASNIIYSSAGITTTAAALTVTIATAALTAGKYEITVEYFV